MGLGKILGDIFTDADFYKEVIPTVGQAALGIFQGEQQADAAEQKYEQDLQLQREQAALELKLQALKARYAGGSGGGGASGKLTDTQRLGAIQSQHELRNTAITSTLNALQNAYGLGQR
jgi:hypothetical protein